MVECYKPDHLLVVIMFMLTNTKGLNYIEQHKIFGKTEVHGTCIKMDFHTYYVILYLHSFKYKHEKIVVQPMPRIPYTQPGLTWT